MKKHWIVTAVMCLAMTSLASAAFVENFDSMGTAGTAPPAGWTAGYLGASGSTNRVVMTPYGGNTKAITSIALTPSDGTIDDTTPRMLNVGTTGSSDRALGSYARTNPYGDHIMQVLLTNDTAYAWTAIDLTYAGEEWNTKQCTAPEPEKLRVLYSDVSATDGFVYMGTAFDFTAPKNAPTYTVLNGNDPANRTVISGTFTLPSALPPGHSFWLRWHDWNDNSTYDHVLAIDDVSVTGIPEPATMGLLGLGGLAMLRRRTKR